MFVSLTSVGKHDEEFCTNLANWADIIRKTFKDGGIDEVISTRRLVHIMRAYAIWGDRMKAIKVCMNRFDDETKQSFIESMIKLTLMFLRRKKMPQTMTDKFHGYVGHLATLDSGKTVQYSRWRRTRSCLSKTLTATLKNATMITMHNLGF